MTIQLSSIPWFSRQAAINESHGLFQPDTLQENDNLVNGFNPYEKYESQLGLFFPIYGKIKKCSKPPTSNFLAGDDSH